METKRLHQLTDIEKQAFLGGVMAAGRLGMGAAKGVGRMAGFTARNPVKATKRGWLGGQIGMGVAAPGATQMPTGGIPGGF